MVYEYSWSNYNFPVEARIVGAKCEEIERRDGSISSSSLVEEARDESSEIHALFEWDDKIAGEQWRLQQAKIVLSCLKVTVKDSDDEMPRKIRAFVNTNPERSKGVYMNIEDAMSNYDTRNGVILRAKKELMAFLDKYSSIKELDELVIEIKKFINNVA